MNKNILSYVQQSNQVNVYNIVCLGCEQWYSDDYVNPSTRICSVMAHVHNSEYSSVHISMHVPVCRVAMLKNSTCHTNKQYLCDMGIESVSCRLVRNSSVLACKNLCPGPVH